MEDPDDAARSVLKTKLYMLAIRAAVRAQREQRKAERVAEEKAEQDRLVELTRKPHAN